MTKLDCNVVSCSYNDDNCCTKGCGCGSNCHKEGAKKETAVACEATECKFNSQKQCSANHIGIAGGHADSCRETECGSFVCQC